MHMNHMNLRIPRAEDGVGGWGWLRGGAHEAHLKLLTDMEKQEETAKPVLRELENDLAKAKESQEACAPQQQSEGSYSWGEASQLTCTREE